MAKTTADIAREIDRERLALTNNVAELQGWARDAVDWRERVRRHPALVCGTVFAGAFAIAQWVGRPSRRPGPLGPMGNAVVGTAVTLLVGALEAAVLRFVDGRRRTS